MNDAEPAPKHDPLAALRQPRFALYATSRLCATFGQTMFAAILAWHVHDIESSAVYLGFLGLARFFPSLGLSLIGGAVADSYNRRNIVVVAQTVPMTCVSVLAVATFGGWVRLELIYAIVVIMGCAAAFEGPARQALLPAIVRPETFANAVTVSTTLQQLCMVSGPALGSLILLAGGPGLVYALYVGLMAISAVVMLVLRFDIVEGSRRRVSLAAIKEGIAYIRSRQEVLGSMTLDMFAVIFGGAQALVPIYAQDILHAGKAGYGILASSLEAGAVLMSLFLIMRPPIRRAGRALILTVVVYGIFTVAFGVSRVFALSVLFYALLGAADSISVVLRTTIIQLTTPDELRGRVSAVNQVFIGASNQVGAMESGFLAALTSATFSVVFGGVTAIGVAGIVRWRLPRLYAYEAPTAASRLQVLDPKPPPRDEGAAAGS